LHGGMHDEQVIKQKFLVLNSVLDERSRRLWAACEAKALGWGGIAVVSQATGLSRTTISAGLRECVQQAEAAEVVSGSRMRRRGGGRKRLTRDDPQLVRDLEWLVDPVTRGDPQSPLRWTCKSTRALASELQALGHVVSARTVARLLHELHYSLQANRKTREGADHPDRDAQFGHINEQTKIFQAHRQPVVSVDTKKKELVGDFKNAGQEWQPQGKPEAVRVYDFLDKKLGKAIPYGVDDVTTNTGWVTVGTDHDTAEFAVETVRHWWQQMGVVTYPQASELLIIADGGGSNNVDTGGEFHSEADAGRVDDGIVEGHCNKRNLV
jgi:transposase